MVFRLKFNGRQILYQLKQLLKALNPKKDYLNLIFLFQFYVLKFTFAEIYTVNLLRSSSKLFRIEKLPEFSLPFHVNFLDFLESTL